MSVLVLTDNGKIVKRNITLAQAAVAADLAGKTIIVNSPQSVDTLTWPSDRALKVELGGVITVATLLTIEGPFEAGLYQVFAGVGTVTFGSGSVTDVYPEWFGAVGDGLDTSASVNHTAIARACASSVNVQFDGVGVYKVNNTIVATNNNINLNGATLQQITDLKNIFDISNATHFSIENGSLSGKGTDYTETDNDRTECIWGTNASNVTVSNCEFSNFGRASLAVMSGSNIKFIGNKVTGLGAALLPPTISPAFDGSSHNYGVCIDQNTTGAVVADNIITQTAQGIIVSNGSSDINIYGNRIYDVIGQHGMYIGAAVTDINIVNNIISNTGLDGIKVQNHDFPIADPAGDTSNINIIGNTVVNTGGIGIKVYNAEGLTTSERTFGVSIVGNVVSSSGGNLASSTSDSMYIGQSYGVSVSGNVLDTATKNGITIIDCEDLAITTNKISNSAQNGIAIQGNVSTDVAILSNTITNSGTAAVSGNRNGIYKLTGSSVVIDSNVIKGDGVGMQYGIFIAGTNQLTDSVTNNVVTGTYGTAARFISASTMANYKNNYFNGVGGQVTNTPILDTVTAANSITLPANKDSVLISGATTIATINLLGSAGRKVTLVFTEAVTVSTASTIKLAGAANLSATANDTLTLVCDGTLWYEVSRSVN